jgi:predicted  nucleic acid-binding Zn ribbon protein
MGAAMMSAGVPADPVAAIVAFPRRRGTSGKRVRARAEVLLATLFKSGQILGEWIPAGTATSFAVVVSLPERDALAARHASPWVEEAMVALRAAGGLAPRVRVVGGSGLEVAIPARGRTSVLVLVTEALVPAGVAASPVFDPVKRRFVPVYALPLDARERERLVQVGCDGARAMGTFLSATGHLERASLRELADPTSPTNRDARRSAGVIEERTGIPCYVELFRHFGLPPAEERRLRCPSCGGAWGRRAMVPGYRYACVPCRLVRDAPADSDPGERSLARVGAFARQSRRRRGANR